MRTGEIPAGNAELARRLGLADCDAKTAIVQVGAAFIEFIEFATPPSKQAERARPVNEFGITHLCFSVRNILLEYARLLESGVRFHAPPMKMPSGAIFTYGRDPDGNVFELIEIPDGSTFPTVVAPS